jgi:hypothetical protein
MSPIFGYEQPWQVRAHLAGLKKERGHAVEWKLPRLEKEIARFEAELERIRDEEKERIKREAAELEHAADEAANV